MSIESIQFTLRERFAAPLPEFYQRRIIFWQDEDREFEAMLDELYIPDVTMSFPIALLSYFLLFSNKPYSYMIKLKINIK